MEKSREVGDFFRAGCWKPCKMSICEDAERSEREINDRFLLSVQLCLCVMLSLCCY